MSLKVRIEVSSTDLPEYTEVNFGTYEIEFELKDLLEASPHPFIYEKMMGKTIGYPDNYMAFLDSIQISPKVRFPKSEGFKS